MINLNQIQIKNFLSIGAISQTVLLNNNNLTLILGENLDLGGDGARNGVGKSALIQAISYALFGQAINQIKKDNLINRTNGKNMLVTIDFSVRGIDYRIIRGRKPNILRFFVNNQEQSVVTDDSQGDSRETQDSIENVLSMTHDIFRQIVALNTYNEPFLGMKVSDQRIIIEQLLGITLLSEKADSIKELNRITKENIQKEEYHIRGIEEANKKIQEQIESLKKRQRLWKAKHREDLNNLSAEYENLRKLDIDLELKSHRDLIVYNSNLERQRHYDGLIARQISWKQKHNEELSKLIKLRDKLLTIDIDLELNAHVQLREYQQLLLKKSSYDSLVQQTKNNIKTNKKTEIKLVSEIETLVEHKCYACGQEFHDEKHAGVLADRQTQLEQCKESLKILEQDLKNLLDNPIVVIEKPTTHYNTESEAIKHSNDINTVLNSIESKIKETDPYSDQISELSSVVLGPRPNTVYDTEEQARAHQQRVNTLIDRIAEKTNESDPYDEQIKEMENSAIQSVDLTNLNYLTQLLQHQDFLLDLLTNKKSFIRKKIIEQNLNYLNLRLTHYLNKMGLPHSVIFQNDLSVEITELGRDLDFYNLSRGEMNRLVLSLSFAFRDVFESLYSPINVMFIDELLDSGMDSIGTENGIAVLKDMVRKRNKSILLISHKDELSSRVNSLLRVVKNSGFTSYEIENSENA